MSIRKFLLEAKLSKDVVTELLRDRPSKSLARSIRRLPIIPNGKYIGNMPAAHCETNTKKYKRLTGADVYEGYLIWRDPDGELMIVSHTFNVANGKVHEVTKLDIPKWSDSTYIGENKS